MNMTKILRWLTATDERTWIGHGLQGLLFGCLAFLGPGYGLTFTAGAFLHREADNYLNATNRAEKLRDCFMDAWSPLAAAMLMEALAAVL